MSTVDRSPHTTKSSHDSHDDESRGDGHALSRRRVLAGATAAAGVAAGASLAAADTTPPGGYGAPLVELHFPVGVLTVEQKAAMIKGVTDVIVDAAKIPTEQANNLWVQIFETADAGWGYGGRVLAPRPR